ncbi:DUF1569 domain-containing protein [Mucilaginibacter sp. BT774]|uniref:DUF1569 domain-containing protein n=1 Tax=Mucilaginibacter sp. BT774 TaxID=3062276 RepID=UPI00267697C8|nr:DUF1569 domain-containing protein [Mucilaginibacter sp. BT774]MDO3625380.1 DUF1569 domain-containing protein [Mucilaginibacter sp. BT774]
MKTIFDRTTRDVLINRINSLNENSMPQWGKMNVYQMIKHCTLWEEMVSGELKCKRALIGRVFGKMALKSLVKDESPLRRSTPTSPELIVTETSGDIIAQKAKWIALIEKNAQPSNTGFIHPFFGQMTREQVGHLAYKHIDHHLRQFNK